MSSLSPETGKGLSGRGMTCEEVQRFAEAYADGEFGEPEQVELEAHLDGCPDCSRVIATQQAFRQFLRESFSEEEAPAHLREAISVSIRAPSDQRLALSPRSLIGLAAALFVTFMIPGLLQKNLVDDTFSYESSIPVIEASVDWHRRSLPVEVTGPDANTVSQWFHDKVDFPVNLPEFHTAHASNVLGGRLTHLNNQNAAHIVYDVEGSKVSVIMFANNGDLQLPRRKQELVGEDYFRGTSSGYNVALFDNNGVTYSITTDLPAQSFNSLVSNAAFYE